MLHDNRHDCKEGAVCPLFTHQYDVWPYISLLFSSGHMKLSFVIHLLSKDEVVS